MVCRICVGRGDGRRRGRHEDAEDEEGPSVREWVKTYGVDPEYGLRRNRRMTENYFQRIIRMPYIRLVSKYGVVYADEYPALKSDEDDALDLDNIVQISSNYRPQYHEPFVHGSARFVESIKRVIFIGGGDSMLLQMTTQMM